MKKSHRTLIERLNAGGYLRGAHGSSAYTLTVKGGGVYTVQERTVTEMRKLGLLVIDKSSSVSSLRPAPEYNKLSEVAAAAVRQESELSSIARKRIRDVVAAEGFDYAFASYTHFPEIENDEFHAKRKAYLAAREDLRKFCGLGEED